MPRLVCPFHLSWLFGWRGACLYKRIYRHTTALFCPWRRVVNTRRRAGSGRLRVVRSLPPTHPSTHTLPLSQSRDVTTTTTDSATAMAGKVVLLPLFPPYPRGTCSLFSTPPL